MNKSWYVKHCKGAIISYITSLLGIIVPLVFCTHDIEYLRSFHGFLGLVKHVSYYAGVLLTVICFLGVLFSFYFCLMIIFHAFKDTLNKKCNDDYKYLLGLFSSFALVFMKYHSEYNLPIIYKLLPDGGFYFAVAADIPSIIAVLSSLYFLILLTFKYFKSFNIKNNEKK